MIKIKTKLPKYVKVIIFVLGIFFSLIVFQPNIKVEARDGSSSCTSLEDVNNLGPYYESILDDVIRDSYGLESISPGEFCIDSDVTGFAFVTGYTNAVPDPSSIGTGIGNNLRFCSGSSFPSSGITYTSDGSEFVTYGADESVLCCPETGQDLVATGLIFLASNDLNDSYQYPDYSCCSGSECTGDPFDLTVADAGSTVALDMEGLISDPELIVTSERTQGCDINENDTANCQACIASGGIYTAIGCLDPSPIGVITGLIRIGFGIMGGVALIQLIFAGIAYQAGDEGKIQEAKKRVMGTIGGIALLVFSVLLLRVLGVNVLDVLPQGAV